MLSRISVIFSKLSWSLRKFGLDIEPDYLVLEVGSGGNPHPASDVLLEKYIDNSHRLKSIRIDRPIVLADACRMPFKDKSFDYVIAFHVLEHVDQPELFFAELMRVAKAGYIETPNAIYERLHPFDVHLLEVAEAQGKLIVHRKSGPVQDPYLSGPGWLERQPVWRDFFEREPKAFHVCFHWRDRIEFEVVNPEQSLAWFKSPPAGLAIVGEKLVPGDVRSSSLRSRLISLVRRYYVWRKGRSVDLSHILVCPVCRGRLAMHSEIYRCLSCGSSYRHQPVPDFTEPHMPPKV